MSEIACDGDATKAFLPYKALVLLCAGWWPTNFIPLCTVNSSVFRGLSDICGLPLPTFTHRDAKNMDAELELRGGVWQDASRSRKATEMPGHFRKGGLDRSRLGVWSTCDRIKLMSTSQWPRPLFSWVRLFPLKHFGKLLGQRVTLASQRSHYS